MVGRLAMVRNSVGSGMNDRFRDRNLVEIYFGESKKFNIYKYLRGYS